MATGPGFTDAQGVYMLGEADERPLASDLFNLPGASISAQLGLVRNEIQNLRDLSTPTDYTPTAAAGSAIGSNMLVTKLGRLVHVQLHLTRTTGAFVASSGLAWLPQPYGGKQQRPLASWFGSGQVGHIILASSGQLQTDVTVPIAGATVLYGNFIYVSNS
ncbi:hypothetical protein [Leucobacter sp. GX0328]